MMKNPSVMKLVERQMCNWELARSQKPPMEPKAGRQVQDFVSISREVGAGAGQIGVLLGVRLNWPVFDKDILHAMAGDDALREKIYGTMDERDAGWCESMLRPLLEPGFVKDDYFHRLSNTILALARKGSAVFIGRGADLILPREYGLRVRIVAPLQLRIKRMAERLHISEGEARKEIERLEDERAQYIRHHFHVDVHDTQRYDLVINLGKFAVAQAVHVIEAARRTLKKSAP